MRNLLLLLPIVPCFACTSPPVVPPPRPAVGFNASVDRTWIAAVDVFAALNIPIKNIDRASGLLASNVINVSSEIEATHPAECGPNAVLSTVNYTVIVRGDSVRSTALASAHWIHLGPKTFDCATLGVWERAFEDSLRRRLSRP